MDLSGYHVESIQQDGEFLLCRACAVANSTLHPPSVLVSTLTSEHPLPAHVRMLEHEATFRDDLDSTWALRPIALAQYLGRPALILEDQPGEPLARLLDKPRTSHEHSVPRSAEPAMALGPFLKVAVGLASALGEVHRRGIVHRNIKPAHVLVNAVTGQVWLTGFGIASRLSRERQTPEPPETIAGTLAYMAPEQTGRMNRSIDCRSDLYALGVTLYEMLTGSLPFTASEPIEWVHCHMARHPTPPGERVTNVPDTVSAIIMKLLAKTGEERYQTAAGLERDLRRCLDDWEGRETIAAFSLGERDHSDRLLIPEKLYGREREVETLLVAFDAMVASATPQLVLVSGYSGLGKSSVVGELHKALVPPRGLFASGKFDQLKRNVPYAPLAEAFHSLIPQLLAKPEAELIKWREQLRRALHPNGALLMDLIPELRFVIGETPPVPEVPPTAAKARFQMTLRQLIGAFARAEHPLALFLDDLQWLDGATLDLLEDILVEPEAQHLLLIGAYRDNEVDAAHPLMRTLSVIRESGAVIQDIVLGPLGHEDLTRWFADALRCSPEQALPLAQLVHEKTGGNPFFANQFLQELVADGQIRFEPGDAAWRWDLGPIRAKGYTDNVVDLMVGKLNRLSPNSQEVVKALAYLGNVADASTLAMAYGASENQLDSDLWEALRLELVVRADDSYRFVHDRVQEAAYSLVSEGQRAAGHLRIARLLTRRTAPDCREEAVFEIVGHFNRAISLIASSDEREQVAALNLLAGKRAKKAAAFASAINYLAAGAALVESERWDYHDLAFELELHRAECEYLNGDVASAERRLSVASTRATSVVERCAVASLQAEVYFALQQAERGLSTCIDCLRQSGFDIPLRPTEAQARAAYDRISLKLDTVGLDAVAALPLVSDVEVRAILELLSAVHACAATVSQPCTVLIVCTAIDLVLQRGLHDTACHAFGQLGYLAGWHFNDFKPAFRLGQLGYELIERRGLSRFEGLVCLNVSTLVLPWAKHVRQCRSVIRRTFEVAHNTGNRFLAVIGSNILLSNLLLAGDLLVDVEREAEVCRGFCRAGSYDDYTDALGTQVAFIRSLRGLTPRFGSLDDEEFDEGRMENRFRTRTHIEAVECWYWIRKLQARFLAGDYAVALESSRRAQGLLTTSPGMLERAEHELYSALTHAALSDSLRRDEGRKHLDAMVAHHRQLEVWARHCPENFENRSFLVAAEIARLEGRDPDATRLYEQAIRSARENGFMHSEALALELAARFYAARGFDRIAKAYLRDARQGYRQWGAAGKVRQLDEQYPYLRDEASIDPTRTLETPVEHLDIATVVTLSQAVSSETDLESLIARVMRLALEHAGAQRGLLILPHGDTYRIEAEARIEGTAVSVGLRQMSIASGQLPSSVFHYVLRTRESILLHDASVANGFSDDDHVRRNRVRSVLCMPLLKQARLVGVIYLENNLTAGAFTSGRMALLELLASEAAVSLENALLYDDLQERERESRLIVDTIPGLVATLTPTGEVEAVNEQVLAYCGRTMDELKQWGTSDTVHPDDLPRAREIISASMTSGEPYEILERIRRFDGVYRWFQVRGLPLRDSNGRIVRWYVLLTDIDDLKRAEAELGALKDQLYKENIVLRDEVDRTSMFEEIVGTSPALHPVLTRVAKVARTESTVLITGETGTGKELVARAIHRRSARGQSTFVGVNCAAVPRELIASELFGHEKGAFTGATQRRLGRFELAHGGTIFLDEVGELPMETQIALLRVLQERQFERVGGTAPVHVDVRVIAATNRDLQAAVDAGSFRSDLFYRLSVFPIEVPALRARADDIPLLVEYFIARYARNAGKSFRRVNKRTLDQLRSYPWPGNVRELQNVIERSVIVCDTDEFTIDESWLSARPTIEGRLALSGTLAAHEKAIIEDALRASGGRVFGPSGAAARLGIPRSTLESKIRAMKINKNRFRARQAKH